MKRLFASLAVFTLILTGCAKKVQNFGPVASIENHNVQYPKLVNEPVVNKAIESMANNIIKTYKPNKESSINYTFVHSDDTISIAFNGEVNSKKMAHPTKVYECATLAVDTGVAKTLKDYFTIDKKFVAEFTKLANKKLAQLGTTTKLEDIFTNDEIAIKLENAGVQTTETMSDACIYATYNTMLVRMGVPHVYGDFIEVEVPYNKK